MSTPAEKNPAIPDHDDEEKKVHEILAGKRARNLISGIVEDVITPELIRVEIKEAISDRLKTIKTFMAGVMCVFGLLGLGTVLDAAVFKRAVLEQVHTLVFGPKYDVAPLHFSMAVGSLAFEQEKQLLSFVESLNVADLGPADKNQIDHIVRSVKQYEEMLNKTAGTSTIPEPAAVSLAKMIVLGEFLELYQQAFEKDQDPAGGAKAAINQARNTIETDINSRFFGKTGEPDRFLSLTNEKPTGIALLVNAFLEYRDFDHTHPDGLSTSTDAQDSQRALSVIAKVQKATQETATNDVYSTRHGLARAMCVAGVLRGLVASLHEANKPDDWKAGLCESNQILQQAQKMAYGFPDITAKCKNNIVNDAYKLLWYAGENGIPRFAQDHPRISAIPQKMNAASTDVDKKIWFTEAFRDLARDIEGDLALQPILKATYAELLIAEHRFGTENPPDYEAKRRILKLAREGACGMPKSTQMACPALVWGEKQSGWFAPGELMPELK